MDAQAAYRRAAAQAASPVRLVIMLYDQLASNLRGAVTAIERKDIEARAREMDRALTVLGHLQATLNFEQGGEVARNLDHFYNLLRSKLLDAQLEDTPTLLKSQIENVLSLREAWLEVEKAEASKRGQDSADSAADSGAGAWHV